VKDWTGLCDFVRSWQLCRLVDDAYRVSTLVQMPSGSIIELAVRQHGEHWVVSDSGSAIEEATKAGIDKPSVGLNIRRAIRLKGLQFADGRIESPPVPMESLQAAAIAVANTSRDVAEAFILIGRDEREYSLDRRARNLLIHRFHTWVSAKPVIVRGQSEKEHRFDTAVILPNGKKVLVDAVNHHANSINSRVVANLDVKQLEDPSIIQRIVFDPLEEWRPEDLKLLKVGATPVALPQLARSIERVA
jgi:hypothetical protein